MAAMVAMMITHHINPMSMSDEKDPMSQYVRPQYPALKKDMPRLVEAGVEVETTYQAIKEARRGTTPRFRLVMRTGEKHSFGYAYLLNWHYAPKTAMLTLQLTTHVIILMGKNLDRVDDLLMEEKIKELTEFDAELFPSPANDEAVITEIEINSLWQGGDQEA